MEQEKQQDYKYTAIAQPLELTTRKLSLEDGQVEINITKIDIVSETRLFLYIAACTANLAAFTCGITIGWSSPVIPKLQNATLTPLTEVVGPSEVGWIGSLLPLGATLGPFIAGVAADKIGRKRTLLLGNIPFIVGFLLNIVAKNVNYLLFSRLICGISVGITFTVLPMYVGEIAEDEVRGALGTYLQLFCVIGLLFSFVVGPYISVTLFNAACLLVPSTFLITFFFFIPESPYFLLQIQEDDEAEAALMKLRDRAIAMDVKTELDSMKRDIETAAANKGSFKEIFKSKGLTKAYILSNGLLFFQQMSGINVVLFFAQNIFQDAGVSLAPEICTIIIGVVQVAFSGVTAVIVDKYGKRLLLMISAIGMTISQGVLAYFFHLKDTDVDVTALAWLPIVCVITYIISYCLGFGPIPWAIMGEMFPSHVKTVAVTVTSATCWFLAFLLTNYFGILVLQIGKAGSFGLFGTFCFLSLVFVYKFLPETSGKSLQEIQDMLN
ncbi:hypothetical protein ABEB36_012126 [Hypothenemus hampei]|uniref:Major facilitator superfamily (MFS) profile domain-containing protein n=1 Tax=Hypothenemus hampei TaxID=57062 RepID=A0ABD1EAU4_HYPHA